MACFVAVAVAKPLDIESGDEVHDLEPAESKKWLDKKHIHQERTAKYIFKCFLIKEEDCDVVRDRIEDIRRKTYEEEMKMLHSS